MVTEAVEDVPAMIGTYDDVDEREIYLPFSASVWVNKRKCAVSSDHKPFLAIQTR